MKVIINYVLILTIFISLPLFSNAQDGTYHTIRDFETWSSINLRYKPTNNIKLSLSQQLRLKDNSSTMDVYFTQLGLDYKLANFLSIGFASRLITENDDQGKIKGNESHLRWQADLEFNHSVSRFAFKYRIRYQNKDELQKTTDEIKKTIRLKVASTYNIKNWKLDPTLSAELFNGITNNDGIYKARYTLSSDYKLKKGSLGAFLRTEKELFGDYPKRTNILGIKYNFTIKKKNK
ncbi:MAG: DUF2490 domain-containing protein [Bacteroidia bacterium]|nr:DUF2490 domain-containing protein [Bacteroidia bacterium]